MRPSDRSYVIVVGIDYSEVSRLALREAFQTACERLQSEVHVLRVRTAVLACPHAEPDLQPTENEVLVRALERLQRVVRDELARFQEAHRKIGAKPFGLVSHVRSNAPGEEIAQLAEDLRADLVVVGTHGRTGIARLPLGSVAQAVVTRAPCPVLVVREKNSASVRRGVEPACVQTPGVPRTDANFSPTFERN